MKVLVTGASGMLGGAVAAVLVARGDDVSTFQRRPSGVVGARDVRGDLADPAAVAAAVAGCDGVVNLAAKVAVSGAERDYVTVNVEGTRALVGAAQSAGVTRFVQTSSPSVAHTGSSLVGAGPDAADPERARGPYARTKAAAELLALAADAPRFAVVAVRPHLVWGPGDTQLAGRIIERSRQGRMVVVGDGAALIDTVYVDDAAAALVAALDRAGEPGVHGRAFVVTAGQPRTVGELLERMARAGGAPPPSRHVRLPVARALGGVVEAAWAVLRRAGSPVADDEPPLTRFLAEQLGTAHWFDQRRTRQALGWSPRVGLDEGFERLALAYARRGAIMRS